MIPRNLKTAGVVAGLALGIGYCAGHYNDSHRHRRLSYQRTQKVYRGSDQQLAGDIKLMASAMNDEGFANYLLEMEDDIGKSRMANVFVGTVFNGAERDKILEVAERKKKLPKGTLRTKYKNNPEGYAKDFLGYDYDSLMNGDIRLVLFRTVVRSGMEAAGMTKLHDHYDTLVEAGVPTGNYIAEFRQRNHRDPLPGELAMGRLGNYITYDSNRDPSTEYSVTSRWNLSNDQSGERRDIYPLGQPGMRVVSEQTNAERRQQLNQFGNQLGNAGRNFLNGVAQGGGRNVSQERPFDPRRLLFQNQRRK